MQEYSGIMPPENQISIDQSSVMECLKSKGWPVGLQKVVLKTVQQIPYRYFICDDSGSMSMGDSRYALLTTSGIKMVDCTRWTEMTQSAQYLATMAHEMQLPSEFRMLNGAPPVVIGGFNSNIMLLQWSQQCNKSPGGGTPLCRHIVEVINTIQGIAPQLRQSGQKAVVIILTDGEASDGQIAQAMAPLQNLPVWVVVRLCTDSSQVVDYWNAVDRDLEFELDVIDDFIGEGEEISRLNPWLTYGEPLHRLREFGVHVKELDMIDEAALSADQMRSVVSIILDIPLESLPNPKADWAKFLSLVTAANRATPQTWSSSKKSLRPWIDIIALKKMYGPASGCCTVM